MQERRFDLAVQLHGSGRLTNPLVRAFAARRTVGYRPPAISNRLDRHGEDEAEADAYFGERDR